MNLEILKTIFPKAGISAHRNNAAVLYDQKQFVHELIDGENKDLLLGVILFSRGIHIKRKGGKTTIEIEYNDDVCDNDKTLCDSTEDVIPDIFTILKERKHDQISVTSMSKYIDIDGSIDVRSFINDHFNPESNIINVGSVQLLKRMQSYANDIIEFDKFKYEIMEPCEDFDGCLSIYIPEDDIISISFCKDSRKNLYRAILESSAVEIEVHNKDNIMNIILYA